MKLVTYQYSYFWNHTFVLLDSLPHMYINLCLFYENKIIQLTPIWKRYASLT